MWTNMHKMVLTLQNTHLNLPRICHNKPEIKFLKFLRTKHKACSIALTFKLAVNNKNIT